MPAFWRLRHGTRLARQSTKFDVMETSGIVRRKTIAPMEQPVRVRVAGRSNGFVTGP
jgi:hypothetical protein